MMEVADINWSKTKRRVQNILDEYNHYILSLCDTSADNMENEFKLSLIKPAELNNDYIKLSEEEKENRSNFINYVRYSYNKLPLADREIIYWAYMEKEKNYDDRYIANYLGFSIAHYYVKKRQALLKFAYALGIEVNLNK